MESFFEIQRYPPQAENNYFSIGEEVVFYLTLPEREGWFGRPGLCCLARLCVWWSDLAYVLFQANFNVCLGFVNHPERVSKEGWASMNRW